MKIIAGHFRGIKIDGPKGLKFRPTANIVREAVFNVLASFIKGSAVLDLFAGSGSFGFEALSRDADRVVFVDSSLAACNNIKQIGQRLGVQDRIKTFNTSALQAVKLLLSENENFSVIFLDPPYDSDWTGKLLGLAGFTRLLEDESYLICESSVRTQPPSTPSGMEALFSRKYGETMVKIYGPIRSHANEI